MINSKVYGKYTLTSKLQTEDDETKHTFIFPHFDATNFLQWADQ